MRSCVSVCTYANKMYIAVQSGPPMLISLSYSHLPPRLGNQCAVTTISDETHQRRCTRSTALVQTPKIMGSLLHALMTALLV